MKWWANWVKSFAIPTQGPLMEMALGSVPSSPTSTSRSIQSISRQTWYSHAFNTR